MVRQAVRLLALVLLVSGTGCHTFGGNRSTEPLSRAEALRLAVELANDECNARYSVSPFTETDYTIEFSAGLWQWGGLDVAGSAGYSARVSFDSTGGARQIEVFYSTDRIVPRH
jgi:hypothetical protein